MPAARAPHRLYVHLAWPAPPGIAAMTPGRRATIESHILAGCRWIGAEPIEVCVLADRVHLLASLPAVLSVHELATHVRRIVEELLADVGCVVRWGTGFAAITVSPPEVRRVRRRLASLGLPDEPPVARPRTDRPRRRPRLRRRRGRRG